MPTNKIDRLIFCLLFTFRFANCQLHLVLIVVLLVVVLNRLLVVVVVYHLPKHLYIHKYHNHKLLHKTQNEFSQKSCDSRFL